MFRTVRSLLAFICVSATAARFCYGVPSQADSIIVTPRNARVETRPGHAHSAVVFRVHNGGKTAAQFVVGCSNSGSAHDCRLAGKDTITVASGTYALVPVRYKAGAAGAGRVTMTAGRAGSGAPKDSGSYDIGLVGPLCVEGCGGSGSVSVWLSPGTSTVSTPQLDVYVEYCSFGSALNATSRSIRLNGSSVTGQFSYTTMSSDCDYNAYSEGTVTLQSGSNTLTASISNNGGQSGSATAYYTLIQPMVAVRVTPASSSFAAAERYVTIDWCSNGYALNSSTRNITFNGSNVTTQFSYFPGTSSTCPNGDYAQSTGTVDLQGGANTLNASISNTASQSGSDAATYTFTIPILDVVNVNPGSSVRRDLCLTIAAGPEAAYECGDLRIVHPLPAVRTRNKERAPVLIYNSDHADPTPIVAANVTPPVSGGTPSTVSAILRIANTSRAWATWTGWTAGTTRRLALSFDGSADTTGIYDYMLEQVSPDLMEVYTSTPGKLAIVQRYNSPFGAGWWLAGLERLNPGTMMWVGGDGSVAQYVPVTTNVWAAASVDHPDTLKWDGVNYIRYLPRGIRVKFDTAGYHVATVSPRGDSTSFAYYAGRLTHITLPTGSAAALTYDFNYDANGYLSSVSSPGPGGSRRITTIWRTVVRIDSIGDPDGTKVKFGYSPTRAGRITSRTDRRGTVITFEYAAGANRLSKATIDPPDLIITNTFAPSETKGLNGTSPVDPANVYTLLDGPRTDVADTTHFVIDRFGAPSTIRNALGYVTRIHRGNSTFPALATQVDEPNGFVRRANYDARGNLKTAIELNPYGTGADATTRYEYGTSGILVDYVQQVVRPMGDSTVMGYNTDGTLSWQQVGNVTSTRVNYRYYNANGLTGLVRAVAPPISPPDSITYDSLGNLRGTRTPSGFWSYAQKDGIGQDTLLDTPVDNAGSYRHREQIFYDVLGRDTLHVSAAPAVPYVLPRTTGAEPGPLVSADTVLVVKSYDPEGNLLSESHGGTDFAPTASSWTYDAIGRVTAARPPGYGRDSTVYDLAGNALQQLTRRGHVIGMQYDALNRLTRRTLPGVAYGLGCQLHPRGCWDYTYQWWESPYKFPLYTNRGTDSLALAPDTQTFKYDAAGRTTQAKNRYARVGRAYNSNGTLMSDTLSLRRFASASIIPVAGAAPPPPGTADDPYVDSDYTKTYVLGNEYDLAGRRTLLHHPNVLEFGSTQSTFGYDPVTGNLQQTVDVSGNVFTFSFDDENRLTATQFPGSGVDSLFYNNEGWVQRHVVRTAVSGILRNDNLTYDARGNVQDATTSAGEWRAMRYSGSGQLIAHQSGDVNNWRVTEEWRTDGVARMNWARSLNVNGHIDIPGSQYSYSPGTDRLSLIAGMPDTNLPYEGVPDTTYTRYDLAGNVMASGSRTYGKMVYQDADSLIRKIATNTYFAADGKPMVTQHYDDNNLQAVGTGQTGSWQEFWYDALGRRVLIRTRQDSLSICQGIDCHSAIQRNVWDGDQLLYELKAQVNDASTETQLENDYGSDRNYGRVRYAHGLSLDRPLSLTIIGYPTQNPTIIPHANFRGEYDKATTPGGGVYACNSGQSGCAYIAWPAPLHGMYYTGDVPPSDWAGSLVMGQADASGLMYKRNRYYDPKTGQFTQEDPIGLAGGLNLYGFAGGDPVNYSDPFGLCPLPASDCPPGYFTKIGASSGLIGGTMVATGCVATTGICAVGAPWIIGGMSALGTSVGAAGDAIAQNSGAMVAAMGRTGNRIRSIITGLAIGILDAIGGERTNPPTPPEPSKHEQEERKKPGKENKPPPSGSDPEQ